MSSVLSSQLKQIRQRSFVGREYERELFQTTIAQEPLSLFVLHLYGPGGVGKTTLLKEFANIGQAQPNSIAIYLDARNIEASPASFCIALLSNFAPYFEANDETNTSNSDECQQCLMVLKKLGDRFSRIVVLIDTYELLKPLDSWLHEFFVPEMPDRTMLIFAGRHSPSIQWRDDPAWGTVFRALPLRNLSSEESRAYLKQRHVPEAHYNAILQFTHGHPLALSLVADTSAQRSDVGVFQPEENPDVIKTLLERFVQKVPSPAHRATLEACGMVRLLTESLLATMLSTNDVSELFDWLRGLSFIESGRSGLFPHDLAREAISTDVRWRNPEWYAELHKRAREYYTKRLTQLAPLDQTRMLFDLVFLHRDNAVVRQTFDWQENGTTRVERAQPEQFGALIDMTRRWEGEQSAKIVAHWLNIQPQHTQVFREGNQLVGFMTYIALDELSDDDIQADPLARNAWAHIKKNAPIRSGEKVLLFRHWMSAETYQNVSPVQSLVFVLAVRLYLVTPKLAYTFFSCAYPEVWEPVLAYADLERLTQTEVVMGDKRIGLYGHDWRVVGVPAWFQLLADRELAYNPQATQPRPKATNEMIALSEDDFSEALRDVLKMMSRSLPPRGNPLLNSRLVADHSTASASEIERATLLRSIIAESAKQLEESPRDVKLYRAFYHTYIKPAPSQEAASEMIDVPFSSYRRHLQSAVERITDLLWAKEIGA